MHNGVTNSPAALSDEAMVARMLIQPTILLDQLSEHRAAAINATVEAVLSAVLTRVGWDSDRSPVWTNDRFLPQHSHWKTHHA